MRKPKVLGLVPNCTSCNKALYCLGYKVEIPKKRDLKSWEKLRGECQSLHLEEWRERDNIRVKRKHDIERELLRLEAMEENKDRSKMIKGLKEELKTLSFKAVIS